VTNDLLGAAIDVERAKRRARKIVDAEESPPRAPLRALSLAELFERPRPSYLIDQWFPDGGLCELVGSPETLKSFFMCHGGLAIASGQADFFGYQIVKHGPVLYIAAEGGGAFQYRVRAWCREHHVDPMTIPFHVIPMPVDLRNEGFQRELLDIVESVKPVLVVVDTLSRCTPGAEENSARDMGEAVSFCTELQTKVGATVAFIHHPTKNDPRGGGRGSGAILGAVDTEIRAAANGEQWADGTRPIQFSCTKQKDDLKPPPLNLIGYVVPVHDLKSRPMLHASGRALTTLLLRVASEDDQKHMAQVAVAAPSKLGQAVISYLAANPRKSKDEIRRAIKRSAKSVGEEVDALTKEGRLSLETQVGQGGKKQLFSVCKTATAHVWETPHAEF
jgi:RecA-family ATPase